ncbi:MAG: FAD-dependent oxidoreductase [Rhodothermales bacterium]
MDDHSKRIAVVGQGVMGLTSALRLQALGFSVTIFSKETLEETTSMAAGAYWWPHKAYPQERVSHWAKATYEAFKIARNFPETGIHFEPHFRFCLDPDDGAYARHLVDEWQEVNGADYGVPCAEAYQVMLPVIDVPVFMPYLRNKVLAAGGEIHIQELHSPVELFQDFDMVINCTGVWAYHFVEDKTVYPIRGQAVRISLPDGYRTSTRIFEKEDKFTLILPRTTDVILGGTAQEGDWDRVPREADTAIIVERCRSIVPAIAGSEVLGATVGLRPGRETVRLELEMLASNQPVIHNYGHGGGGFTVSWGCADEVASLATAYFSKHA